MTLRLFINHIVTKATLKSVAGVLRDTLPYGRLAPPKALYGAGRLSTEAFLIPRGGKMKARFKARSAVAVAVAVGVAVSGAIFAPAQGATRTTVVMQEPSAMTSLNSSTSNGNLVTNSDIAYLQGFGFTYANNEKKLVQNTKFGTYKVVKNKSNDFRIQYTVNPGLIWSDGTPITADDLLLTHIISSNDYSIKAGLGDPDDAKNLPAFDSGSYGSTYANHIVGNPVLSSDHMSLTMQWDTKIANWDYYAPGPFPVHTLELLAAGKKALGSVADNKAAKAKFYDDFTKMNTASLKAMGKAWSTAYDITTVNDSTNPLLLVGNGNFQISSAVDNQSVTLTLNSKLNGMSGPKTDGFTKMIFRFDVSDAAAPQALANKEIDLYQGQVTPDAVASLKQIKGVNLIGGTQATYEQISLRVAAAPGQKDTYSGPFKNALVRKAFLLAYPREEILAKLISPVVPTAKVLDSRFVMPDEGSTYDSFIKGNGSATFSAGTQAKRTAEALRIMKSVYGSNVLSSPVAINMDYKNSARRIDAFTIAQKGLALAGFKLTGAPNAKWSAELDLTKYDAAMFAWGAGLPVQAGDCGQIKSTVGNNHFGWNSAKIDSLCESLEGAAMTSTTKNRVWTQTERELMAQYWTLGLYQWPALTVVNSDLSGVKPSAVVPNLVWNYWDWHF